MPYTVNAVKIMIASPGDVTQERKLIREVIAEWNAMHSDTSRVVLMPISWDTHAAPEMGTRAQEVINKQILRDCDLLVAVFWTRIGSSTGVAISGTVEEIEEHLAAGKPAMIYFSQQPVRPDSVDEVQYDAVRAFKASCKERGLIEEYESLGEFRTKFARQLTHTVFSKNYGHAKAQELAKPPLDMEITNIQREIPGLNETARTLLLEAAQDRTGSVLKMAYIGGFKVQTNGKQFVEPGDPRSRAAWEGAIDTLCREMLLEEKGFKGEVYQVTDRGYRVADLLRLEGHAGG